MILAGMPQTRAAVADTSVLAGDLAARQEGLWKKCAGQPDGSVSARDIFSYALLLCEARQHPERLDRLFTLVGQMQDQDPRSRGFGNFWWYWRDGKVTDFNSVDFCMRSGALMWLKDRDFIPAPARARLEKLLDLAVQGCLRHHVQSSYSNIAIMNAGDLILLGEGMARPEAAAEGYARLDRVFQYTQTAGIHEFDSPTYTGVDLDGLDLIETFCQRDSGRAQARALLNLFWTDIALNWFPPAQKLAGAQSRTYDYLHGLGDLDVQLTLNGWLNKPLTAPDTIFGAQSNWHPSAEVRAMADRFPRLVRQSWGQNWWQSRTHLLLPDITLSCASSSYYGSMDMPLTVDWPGNRDSVRGYFIADGRGDPYGKIKIAAGPHQKALHLQPFWSAAQRGTDALGMVVYPARVFHAGVVTLVSNFVMPLDADAFWIGGRRIVFDKGKPLRDLVKPGEAVVLQKGAAALGLRVPWSRGLDGRDAPAYLVYDGNAYGAVRLTVEHVPAGGQAQYRGHDAGAAFWLRIGDGLKTDADFAGWRRQFAAATVTVDAAQDHLSLRAEGSGGLVALVAKVPWKEPESLEPPPTRAVLELNGQDIGAKILGAASAKDN